MFCCLEVQYIRASITLQLQLNCPVLSCAKLPVLLGGLEHYSRTNAEPGAVLRRGCGWVVPGGVFGVAARGGERQRVRR